MLAQIAAVDRPAVVGVSKFYIRSSSLGVKSALYTPCLEAIVSFTVYLFSFIVAEFSYRR